jgi:hypothetical protein
MIARTLAGPCSREGSVTSYRHTQIGLVVIAVLAASIVLVAALGLTVERHPVILIVLVMLGVALALFYSLTVEIRGSELLISFGIGFPRFTYQLSRAREVRVVRNPWYCGWGIHATRDGWLYNVSGFYAVEIVFTDGRKIRVGSDEPSTLHDALAPFVPHEGRQ